MLYSALADLAPVPGHMLYHRLLTHATGLPNDQAFARLVSSQAEGQGILPPGLGLKGAAFSALLARHFPRMGPIGVSGQPASEHERHEERQDLLDLLLEYRAHDDVSELWIAEIVATGCLGGDHLWQDLGLWSRAELSQLMARNFPGLSTLNALDMKWKKFLYRQLCERGGVPVCPAPSCQQCVDHARCFAPE